MAHLHLHLSGFTCSFGVGDALREGWRANWKAGMKWLESVKLSTGSDLSKMQGWLNLKVGEIEAKHGKAIGALSYFPASEASSDGVVEAQPETYFVEVVLSEAQLLRLIELEQQGNGPTGVSVDVPGLKYGVFPDGSDKSWEIDEERNWLAVEGLTFSFNKPVEDEEEAEEEDVVEAGPSAEVRAIYDSHKELQKTLMWVCGLLAALLFAVLLKR